jgi:hypothetical protein
MAMKKENLLAMIKSHNDNVDGFKRFCEKLDEVNGGGFPADKWFQLKQLTPPFARHAAELVREARAAGINAKYDAQVGSINLYEPDGETPPEKKTVTFDVIEYKGDEFAVLRRHENNDAGYVTGMRFSRRAEPTTLFTAISIMTTTEPLQRQGFIPA